MLRNSFSTDSNLTKMMLNLNQVNRILTVLCVAGVAVSIYALVVETKKEHDNNYEAMCDISEKMSCSRVLSSRWGRGFGVVGLLLGEDSLLNQPNSIFGIFFYNMMALLSDPEMFVHSRWSQLGVPETFGKPQTPRHNNPDNILSRFNSLRTSKWLVILTVVSNLMSVYLASILYFVLHDFCIVCVTTYLINALLLVSALYKSRLVLSKKQSDKNR